MTDVAFRARTQAKIDMTQKFIDAIAYCEVKLTDEEVKQCFDEACKEKVGEALEEERG